MDAVDACAVLGVLEDAGIRVVVNGGWGVDALLCEQTREHDDLDVHVSVDDLAGVCDTLAGLGYDQCLARDGTPARALQRSDRLSHSPTRGIATSGASSSTS